MALSKTQIEQIKTMALDGHTEQEICDAVGVSRGTVYKYKPKKNEQREKENEEFKQKYIKVKNEVNDRWFDKLRTDDRQEKIVDKILNLLNDEELLEKEIATSGIRSVVGAYKILVETNVKTKELSLKERNMDIRQQELEIKQKELELRMTNPEAFNTVQIINDAPKPSELDYAN